MKAYKTNQRLKQIMEERNLRQVDILRAAEPYCKKYNIKLGKNDLSQYVSGKVEPGQDKLTILSFALNVSETWLMGYDVPMEKVASKQSSFDVGPENLPALTPYHPTKRIPILGRVAAGLPLLAEENIEGYTSVDFDDDESYYALRVHGDSMSAVGINDGDLVVVRQQTTVDEGQIAVVLVNGNDATIKYFKQQGNMVFLTPKSYNPEHQIQVYNLDETPVRIIGRVVSSQRYY